MPLYQRILVPVDGSSTAKAGLEEALKIASDQRAKLRILHVVDDWLLMSPDASGAPTAPAAEARRAAGDSVLDAADTRARDAGMEVETVLIEEMGYRAGEVIVRQASEWPADLIVCGTHGRRGMRRLVLGSDAEYVLRHTPVPILLVRAPEPQEERHVR